MACDGGGLTGCVDCERFDECFPGYTQSIQATSEVPADYDELHALARRRSRYIRLCIKKIMDSKASGR